MVEGVSHEHQVARLRQYETVFFPDDRMDILMPFRDRLYVTEQLGVDIDSKYFTDFTVHFRKRDGVMTVFRTDIRDHVSGVDS